MKSKRFFKGTRKTKETEIFLELNIDGEGMFNISTTIPFFDHILSLFAKHGLFDIKIKARGDTEVDYHHLVEDMGITLGQGLHQATGEAKGVERYGSVIIPMDEALVMVAVDISGRSGLYFDMLSTKKKIGDFEVDLIEEFLKALTSNAKITLHIKQLSGKNTHHIVEGIFKGLGVALRYALKCNKRIKDIPSTKGKI